MFCDQSALTSSSSSDASVFLQFSTEIVDKDFVAKFNPGKMLGKFKIEDKMWRFDSLLRDQINSNEDVEAAEEVATHHAEDSKAVDNDSVEKLAEEEKGRTTQNTSEVVVHHSTDVDGADFKVLEASEADGTDKLAEEEQGHSMQNTSMEDDSAEELAEHAEGNDTLSTGFNFHCGRSSKEEDAMCQGCWGVAVSMIQAQRSRCGEGDDDSLFSLFITSTRDKTPYDSFCKAVVDGKKAAPKFCAKYLLAGYNGFAPGQGGIDEMVEAARCGMDGLNQLCSQSVPHKACYCQMWSKLSRSAGGSDWIGPTARCASRRRKSC